MMKGRWGCEDMNQDATESLSFLSEVQWTNTNNMLFTKAFFTSSNRSNQGLSVRSATAQIDLAIASLPKSPWNLAKHRGLSWAESWQYHCVVALPMKQLEFWPLIGTKVTKVSQTPCWKVHLSWQVIRNPEGLKDTSSNKSSECWLWNFAK